MTRSWASHIYTRELLGMGRVDEDTSAGQASRRINCWISANKTKEQLVIRNLDKENTGVGHLDEGGMRPDV